MTKSDRKIVQDLSKAYSARKKKTSGKLSVPKRRKRIPQKGPRTIKYEQWRDSVAIPYLDTTFGHECADCGTPFDLAVDHIITRGSRADLKMVLSNVQWLCPNCHANKTDHQGNYKEN